MPRLSQVFDVFAEIVVTRHTAFFTGIKMAGRFFKTVGLLLLSAVLLVGIWQWESHRGERSPQDPPASASSGPSAPAERALSVPAPAPVPPSSSASPLGTPSAPPPADVEQKNAVPVPPLAADGASAPSSPQVPPAAPTAPPSGEVETEAVIKGTLYKGDTVSKLLADWGTDASVRQYVEATRRVFPLTAFRAGQPYVLVCDVDTGTVKRFEYEIDQKRRLVVEDSGGDNVPVARVEVIQYDTTLALVGGRIDDNLFQAVADMGESPQLALQLANLFGWEINFIRDLQEGDSFTILFEKLYREGEFKGYGRTLGATFTNKGKTYEAFLFNDARGQEHHYNTRGENLKKILLQSPLSFTRVTSGFSKSRKHPIFGDHRAHFGVDYGAPTGTPVKAVGDGVVTLRGWVGGYGNQVVLRHAAGLESMYSHLSGFGRGIAKGSRVRQGQVIAFVGSTGNSTGPHLDFRLKQNGTFVNPMKAINPRSEPVPKAARGAFEARMALVRSFMQAERPLTEYGPELIAVAPVPQPAVKSQPPAKKKAASNKKKRRSDK